jgi:hypothetical protein
MWEKVLAFLRSTQIRGIHFTWASIQCDQITYIEITRRKFTNKFDDQLADRIVDEHRVKPSPHIHCLTNQLKNDVHGASSNNLKNYACNWASIEMDF